MLVRQEFRGYTKNIIVRYFPELLCSNQQRSYPKRKKYFKGNMYVQVSSTFQYYLR